MKPQWLAWARDLESVAQNGRHYAKDHYDIQRYETVRREAERRRLVPAKDPMPKLDVVNAFVACAFQLSLGVAAFYVFLKDWPRAGAWTLLILAAGAVLYFTWYKNLPFPDEV